MAQIQTQNTDGEGDINTMPIKKWMQQNDLKLSDKTTKILDEQEIKTIKDLRSITPKEMKLYAKDLKIPFGDTSKLIRTIEKLSPKQNKKNYLNTEEVTIIQSINKKIKEFKGIVDDINSKQINIDKYKQQIYDDINKQFNIINDKLNQRKLALINQLNNIINKKKKQIQSNVTKYNKSLQDIDGIKEQNDELMDTPITMNELVERTNKVNKNLQNITKIINDTKNNNPMQITEKISFIIDTDNILKDINDLGMLSDLGLPVIEKLTDDNCGNVKLFWKIMPQDDDIKQNDNDTKIRIEYKLDDDNKDNNWISKDFSLDNNTNNGNQTLKINKIGLYKFRIKYYKNKLWSSYSMKSININKVAPPILKWNKKSDMYGNYANYKTQFVNDNTVKSCYSVVSVDYVIRADDVDEFCYEFQAIETAGPNIYCAFGFTEYPLNKCITNLNTYLPGNQAYSAYFCNDSVQIFQNKTVTKTIKLTNKLGKGGKVGFKINMQNKTAELFYNRNSLGIVYTNIPNAIIPVASGDGQHGFATITINHTTY